MLPQSALVVYCGCHTNGGQTCGGQTCMQQIPGAGITDKTLSSTCGVCSAHSVKYRVHRPPLRNLPLLLLVAFHLQADGIARSLKLSMTYCRNDWTKYRLRSLLRRMKSSSWGRGSKMRMLPWLRQNWRGELLKVTCSGPRWRSVNEIRKYV